MGRDEHSNNYSRIVIDSSQFTMGNFVTLHMKFLKNALCQRGV